MFLLSSSLSLPPPPPSPSRPPPAPNLLNHDPCTVIRTCVSGTYIYSMAYPFCLPHHICYFISPRLSLLPPPPFAPLSSSLLCLVCSLCRKDILPTTQINWGTPPRIWQPQTDMRSEPSSTHFPRPQLVGKKRGKNSYILIYTVT